MNVSLRTISIYNVEKSPRYVFKEMSEVITVYKKFPLRRWGGGGNTYGFAFIFIRIDNKLIKGFTCKKKAMRQVSHV